MLIVDADFTETDLLKEMYEAGVHAAVIHLPGWDPNSNERMFWGTDITRMPCSWRQCVAMFTEGLPWLSAGDKELIMGRALCGWLDWKLPR